LVLEALPPPTVTARAIEIDPLRGFRFAGHPIHPRAVSLLGGGMEQTKDEVSLVDHPWRGVGLVVESSLVRFDEGELGWDVYRVIDRRDDHYLIESTWNGGGTGHFSSVRVLRLRDGVLSVVLRVGSGDRCNGGIAEDPSFDGTAVLVSHWITPEDLMNLSGRSDLAPGDFEFSAVSCVAMARHRVSPGRSDLVGVKLSPDFGGSWLDDQPGWTENYPRQARFNQVLRKWVAASRLELDSKEIQAFAEEVVNE
jgi:hypothetical protein